MTDPHRSDGPGPRPEDDRAWAVTYLARVLGRPISDRSLIVDQLVTRLAGVPSWRDIDVRGGAHR